LPLSEKIGRFPTKNELRSFEEGKKLLNPITKLGGVFRISSEIKNRVEKRRLPKKYFFASRLSKHTFVKLPLNMQWELAKQDNYYKNI